MFTAQTSCATEREGSSPYLHLPETNTLAYLIVVLLCVTNKKYTCLIFVAWYSYATLCLTFKYQTVLETKTLAYYTVVLVHVTGKNFQPSLIFVGKSNFSTEREGSLPHLQILDHARNKHTSLSERSFIVSQLNKQTCLIFDARYSYSRLYLISNIVTNGDKHSSLLCRKVNEGKQQARLFSTGTNFQLRCTPLRWQAPCLT